MRKKICVCKCSTLQRRWAFEPVDLEHVFWTEMTKQMWKRHPSEKQRASVVRQKFYDFNSNHSNSIFTMMDIDYKSDEEQSKWDTFDATDTSNWKTYEMRFGKYKGDLLGTMIASPKKRSYLRYLLKWPDLRAHTKNNILAAFEHYDDMKRKQVSRSEMQSPRRS